MNMNNNYSLTQRNELVEKHLWCIDTVIRKNRPLMRAAQLEYDDVYQQLALRLIKAVAGFDPQKGTLQQHIFAQLKYELLNCKSACIVSLCVTAVVDLADVNKACYNIALGCAVACALCVGSLAFIRTACCGIAGAACESCCKCAGCRQ